MCSNYTGIKFEPALERQKEKIEHLSSYTHVVHTTAKQVISRHRKNENVFKMSKNEKCTCKACKTFVFHCQMRKFMSFLLPSSSWLLNKRPNILLAMINITSPNWSLRPTRAQQFRHIVRITILNIAENLQIK